MASFGLAELFDEAAFLPPAALAALTDALVQAGLSGPVAAPAAASAAAAASSAAAAPAAEDAPPPPPRPAGAAEGGTPAPPAPKAGGASESPAARQPPSARRPSLVLQLLAEVAMRNRDRFELLWPQLQACFARAFEPDAVRAGLAQPAAVALLRLCVRLAHRASRACLWV